MLAGQFTNRRPGGGFECIGPGNEYSFGVTNQQTQKDYTISFFKLSFTGLPEVYVKKPEEQRQKIYNNQ
jgi:hypothetical protein